MYHHTKSKADIGLAKNITNLNMLNCPKSIRFDSPVNNQNKFVKWTKNYLELKRESSETIRHTPEMVKT